MTKAGTPEGLLALCPNELAGNKKSAICNNANDTVITLLNYAWISASSCLPVSFFAYLYCLLSCWDHGISGFEVDINIIVNVLIESVL